METISENLDEPNKELRDDCLEDFESRTVDLSSNIPSSISGVSILKNADSSNIVNAKPPSSEPVISSCVFYLIFILNSS